MKTENALVMNAIGTGLLCKLMAANGSLRSRIENGIMVYSLATSRVEVFQYVFQDPSHPLTADEMKERRRYALSFLKAGVDLAAPLVPQDPDSYWQQSWVSVGADTKHVWTIGIRDTVTAAFGSVDELYDKAAALTLASFAENMILTPSEDLAYSGLLRELDDAASLIAPFAGWMPARSLVYMTSDFLCRSPLLHRAQRRHALLDRRMRHEETVDEPERRLSLERIADPEMRRRVAGLEHRRRVRADLRERVSEVAGALGQQCA